MSKKQVLNIDIKKYKKETDCPEYSDGYDKNNKHCTFRFFCKDDYCSTVDEKGYVKLFNKDYQMEALNTITIFPSFNSTSSKDDDRASCSKNSDCFTDNCFNNFCSLKTGSPTTECIDEYYYSHYLYVYKAKMHCGSGQYELCKKNNNCASQLCEYNSTIQEKICSPYNVRKDISKQRLYDILIKVTIFIGCVILSTIINCIKSKIKSKKSNEESERSDTSSSDSV